MAVLASDTFTRADETPLASPWYTVYSGTRNINLVSNAATPASVSLNTLWGYSGPTYPNDQYAQATVTMTGTTGSDSGFGPAVRCGAATSNNGYFLTVNKAASNNLHLLKDVANTFTLLASRTITFTDGDTLRLDVSGTTLTIKHNGVVQGATVTDAALASGGGGIGFSSSVTAASLDNWEAGDLAAAGILRQMQQHAG